MTGGRALDAIIACSQADEKSQIRDNGRTELCCIAVFSLTSAANTSGQ
jgi:hypothetical protein